MKKNTLAFFIAVALIFGGCGNRGDNLSDPQNKKSEFASTEESIVPSVSEAVKLLKTTSDSETLSYFWENYIDDTSFTIVNATGFEDASKIKSGNLCSYLYLKIQRDGADKGIINADDYKNHEIMVPAELMKAYAKKYFNDIDLVKICTENPKSGGRYFPGSDTFSFDNVYSPERLPEVAYNQIEEFPNYMLESVSFYSDDTVVIRRRDESVFAIKPQEEFVYFDIKLKKRGENDYYFLSAVQSYTKTDYIKIDGEYKAVDIPVDLSSEYIFKCENDSLYYSKNDGLKAEIFKFTFDSGSNEKIAEFAIDSGDTFFKFLKANGDFFAFTDNKAVYLLNLRDSTVIKEEIINSSETYIEDISLDFARVIVRTENEPLYILDIKTGGKTVLEATTTTNSEKNIMAHTRYANGKFVLNDKKIIVGMYGYESGGGYSLISMDSGKSKFFDVLGGYETINVVTDKYLIAMNVMGDKTICDIKIDFETESLTNFNERPVDYVDNSYTLINPSRGQYSVGIKRIEKLDENIGLYTLDVVNYLTDEKISKEITIRAPRDLIRVIAITPDTKILASINYMGEKYGLLI